ncbi:hypothetical protein ACWFQ8_30310 [Streptomyces sp. NPDC055254]
MNMLGRFSAYTAESPTSSPTVADARVLAPFGAGSIVLSAPRH